MMSKQGKERITETSEGNKKMRREEETSMRKNIARRK